MSFHLIADVLTTIGAVLALSAAVILNRINGQRLATIEALRRKVEAERAARYAAEARARGVGGKGGAPVSIIEFEG